MRYDAGKSFGYPVLAPYSDDFADDYFKADYSLSINNTAPNEFIIGYAMDLKSACHQGLIEARRAGFYIRVTCRSTFYSELHQVERQGSLALDASKLRDLIELSAYLISNEDTEVVSDKINAEYGYCSFKAQKGQVLALTPPVQFIVDKEFWKPITSIFEYKLDDSLKDGEFYADFEDEFVSIFSNAAQLANLKQFEQSQHGKIILVNSVFFSVVARMIELINDKQADYEEKKWARILVAKADARNVDVFKMPPFVAAQRLLHWPFLKLAKDWDK